MGCAYTPYLFGFQSTPPREGGDGDVVRILPSFKRFQSTPPARGATLNKRLKSIIFHISIHAPREGGDRLVHLHQIVTP